MQVENVSDKGVVGCIVLHFKPSALVWWSPENSQVSVTQSQKRESTDIHQLQGLSILANFGKPKLAVGTFVVSEVFDCGICRGHANSQAVVSSLTRVFDTQTKI